MLRFWYLVRGLCLSHGLLFIAAATMVFWQSARSLQWPEVPARVTHSALQQREWLGTTVYWPDVWYQYEQYGEQRDSKTISFFGMAPYGAHLLTDKLVAEKLISDRYAVDTMVNVRMNPVNHQNVVMEVRLLSFDFLLAVGVGSILLYLAWLVHVHMKHFVIPARQRT